jgi:cytochrome c oxidase accessory protein FixG
VFLEEWIRPIENWIEGDRGARMRRDGQGWTLDRLWRKAAKFSAFAALAAILGVTVMSWFAGAPRIWVGEAGPVDYTVAGVIAFAFFWDWAWFREQLCNYVCPYARFQGALTDEHSLVVGYDEERAEPRAKGKQAAKDGRCIDCNQCVVVCPQGIDIRDGFQLECINCARCIDACTDVMGKLGHESLVRYTTIAADEGKKTRWFRPRTVVYAALLTALTAGLVFRVGMRSSFEVTVNRAPGTLFQVDPDGMVRNTYFVAIGNNDPVTAHTYEVQVAGPDGAEVIATPVTLEPNAWQTVPLVVRVPEGSVDRSAAIAVRVSDGETDLTIDTTFKAPHLGGHTLGGNGG